MGRVSWARRTREHSRQEEWQNLWCRNREASGVSRGQQSDQADWDSGRVIKWESSWYMLGGVSRAQKSVKPSEKASIKDQKL